MAIILLSALLATITTCGLYCADFRYGKIVATPKHRKGYPCTA